MRAVLDRLVSWMGLLLAVVLLVAGGLLTWAHGFVDDQVHQQLSEQRIVMPSGAALATPEMKKELGPYAGQPMTTGAQAKAYANYFIAVHVKEASGGKTFAEVSQEQAAAAKANPNSPEATKLSNLKVTVFQGETLRGLLLYGYAFATMGTIAGYAAIGAYIAGVLLLILGILGLAHARRRRDILTTAGGVPTSG